MLPAKSLQYHDIPLVVDGIQTIVKGVSKFTTCDDVISKLSQNGASFAIFIETSGKEKELSGKTKLLKVWRSRGPSKKCVFVAKPSEGKKASRRLSLNIFARNRKSLETASKDKLKDVTPKTKEPEHKTHKILNRTEIENSLKTMKLGFKKTLTSRLTFDCKTTSASTLKSTDTGYQSQTSDMRSQAATPPRHRGIFASYGNNPRHSTPVTHTLNRKRLTANDTLNVTLANHIVPRFDEVEGKSVLMERFMNDTSVCEVRKRIRHADSGKASRSGPEISSVPVLFRSQEEKCRFYWDQNCDSDSDTSCSDDDSVASEANLDEAFVEYCDNVNDFSDFQEPASRKLRRESAVSNLIRFDICAKPLKDTCYDDKTQNTGFEYSFDCSFPEFSDAQDFSVDYSYSETESDLSISFEEKYFRPVKDSDFYSFMKSWESLAINEMSRYHVRDIETHTKNGSDEGLGSMTSDDFIADKEIFI